jgi:hypothetical protein
MAKDFIPVKGAPGMPLVDPPVADGYLQIELKSLETLRAGENEIKVEAQEGQSTVLVDAQLGVIP